MLQPFFCTEGWINRFVGVIDTWTRLNIAIWVERPKVFSIVADHSHQEKIRLDHHEMEGTYSLLAAMVVAAVCPISTDKDEEPDVEFLLPHLKKIRKYAFAELDERRQVCKWTSILCALGYGYWGRGEVELAYKVWVKVLKADFWCWTANTQLVLFYAIYKNTPEWSEQLDFMMWSATKHGTPNEVALFGLEL